MWYGIELAQKQLRRLYIYIQISVWYLNTTEVQRSWKICILKLFQTKYSISWSILHSIICGKEPDLWKRWWCWERLRAGGEGGDRDWWHHWLSGHEWVKVAQLFPTLQPHGLYSPWKSPGQNTGVGSLSLLQGILPT